MLVIVSLTTCVYAILLLFSHGRYKYVSVMGFISLVTLHVVVVLSCTQSVVEDILAIPYHINISLHNPSQIHSCYRDLIAQCEDVNNDH